MAGCGPGLTTTTTTLEYTARDPAGGNSLSQHLFFSITPPSFLYTTERCQAPVQSPRPTPGLPGSTVPLPPSLPPPPPPDLRPVRQPWPPVRPAPPHLPRRLPHRQRAHPPRPPPQQSLLLLLLSSRSLPLLLLTPTRPLLGTSESSHTRSPTSRGRRSTTPSRSSVLSFSRSSAAQRLPAVSLPSFALRVLSTSLTPGSTSKLT